MIGYCTNYLAKMPDITVYMNCDTRLAINLRMFNLGEKDEFIFTIKNYNYIESPYVFMFRARKDQINDSGEVLFKITPATSKHIKPGAFYNFAVLVNAFEPRESTEYKKLTENGNIVIEYGAQDLRTNTEASESDYEVISMRLERLDREEDSPSLLYNTIIGVSLEQVE